VIDSSLRTCIHKEQFNTRFTVNYSKFLKVNGLDDDNRWFKKFYGVSGTYSYIFTFYKTKFNNYNDLFNFVVSLQIDYESDEQYP
jgi:hypothetical protein